MYCLEHYSNKNIMSTQFTKKKGKYNDFNDFYKDNRYCLFVLLRSVFFAEFSNSSFFCLNSAFPGIKGVGL